MQLNDVGRRSTPRFLRFLPVLLLGAAAHAQPTIIHQIILPAGMSWCADNMIYGLLSQINAFRAQNAESALPMDPLGMKDAEMRAVQFAQYMAVNSPASPGFFPHQGYDTTAASLGYDLISENLAYVEPDPAFIVSLWTQDALHRGAMLYGSENVAGVSCVYANGGTVYWTFDPGYNPNAPALTSTPVPVPAPPTPPAAPAPTPAALDTEQLAFLTLINNYRAQNGAPPLQLSATLQNAAEWMSNDLAATNNPSHTDSLGRSTPVRLAAFGYTYSPWGENIAGGFVTAQDVFNAWQSNCDPDPGGNCTYAHRANMLNPAYQAIGIGRSQQVYWVTDFGGTLDQPFNPAFVGGPAPSPAPAPNPAPAPAPPPAPASPLSFITPQNGQSISGLALVSVAMTLPTGGNPVTLSIDGGLPYFMDASSTGYSLSLSTAYFQNGPHTLTVSATDLSNQPHVVSITVTINNSASPQSAAPLPSIASFKATASSITAGQPTILFWTAANATSVSIKPGIGEVTSSMISVSPPATTTYTLTATNGAGSVTATVTVTVAGSAPPQPPAPLPAILSFQAAPSSIAAGQSTVLSWSVANSTSVSINPGIGGVAGSTVSVSPSATTTYTLTATNGAGSVTATATVTVATSTASQPPATPPPAPQSCVPLTGAFTGCYYNDLDLTGVPVLIRADNQINFNWFYQTPAPSVPLQNFSVRWQGNFSFDQGNYLFTALTSDGMRVYVDGILIMNRWLDQATTMYQFQTALSQGIHLVTVEYYEHNGSATAELTWRKN